MVDRLKVKRTITIEYTIIPTASLTPEIIKQQEREAGLEHIASMLKFIDPALADSKVVFEEIYDISE